MLSSTQSKKRALPKSSLYFRFLRQLIEWDCPWLFEFFAWFLDEEVRMAYYTDSGLYNYDLESSQAYEVSIYETSLLASMTKHISNAELSVRGRARWKKIYTETLNETLNKEKSSIRIFEALITQYLACKNAFCDEEFMIMVFMPQYKLLFDNGNFFLFNQEAETESRRRECAVRTYEFFSECFHRFFLLDIRLQKYPV